MNDTAGLVYDEDTAQAFVHVQTGLSEEAVEKFFQAKTWFEFGLEFFDDTARLCPEGWLWFESVPGGVTPAEYRAAHRQFFPERNVKTRFFDTDLFRAFTIAKTDLTEAQARACNEAEEAYMRRVGIID